ncbi:hypothetical protein KCP73_26495 [Salmonella enterica subsp. enterica]|nr:hypothetical protein KCP73_26495 [Salmonella enterica subsp. enterica]
MAIAVIHWIAEGSKLDNAAKIRRLHQLTCRASIFLCCHVSCDDLCSLRANEVRPALACRMIIAADSTIDDDIAFCGLIESKAKRGVRQYLPTGWKNNGARRPDNEGIAQQIASVTVFV